MTFDTTPFLSGPPRAPRRMLADQESRMIDGPLFVGETYLIRREIAALSESRRTESYRVRSRIFDVAGRVLKAETLLNHDSLKASYASYAGYQGNRVKKGVTRA